MATANDPPDIANDDINIIKTMVASGIDPNHAYDCGETLLRHAAGCGFINIVKYLVQELGVDVNTTSMFVYHSPLVTAAGKNHMDIVKYLLDHGADKEYRGDRDFTAVQCAEICHYYDIVEYINSYDGMPTKGVHCENDN
jgi:ankyrin repeat protein